MQALDATNAPTTNYAGIVHFTSSAPGAGLPANATLTNGAHMFSMTLKTTGIQSITPTITGTQNGITVNSGEAAKLAFVQQPKNAAAGATLVTVVAEDAFNNVVTSSNAPITLAINTLPSTRCHINDNNLGTGCENRRVTCFIDPATCKADGEQQGAATRPTIEKTHCGFGIVHD